MSNTPPLRRNFAQVPNSNVYLNYTDVIPVYQQPNEYDLCMAEETVLWDAEIAGRGLYNICCPKGRKPYVNKPWVAMPAEGRRFKPIGVLNLPDLSNPANVNVPFTVLSVYCPLGYNGVITDITCTWVGSGFVDGSGDITWRVNADGRYLRDMGKIITQIGSLTYPSPVPRGGLLVFSRNLVTVTATFSAAALADLQPNGRVVCSVTGWWWAR